MSDVPGSRSGPPPIRSAVQPLPVKPVSPNASPRGVHIPPPEHRTAQAFSVELVLSLLQAAGAIPDLTRREALARENAQRGRLLKERGGGKVGGPRYVVSP